LQTFSEGSAVGLKSGMPLPEKGYTWPAREGTLEPMLAGLDSIKSSKSTPERLQMQQRLTAV